MVQDAEAHAEEDKVFQQLVSARNNAEAMINASEKALREAGDKVSGNDKSNIESAIAALKEALKTSDKDTIEAKTKSLTEASGKLAEQMYQQASQAAPTSDAQSGGKSEDSEAVDAEFEEVKESK